MSASTVVILAVLVGATVWSWQRGSRSTALVFALVAALPATTLVKATPWPALEGAAPPGSRWRSLSC